MKKDIGYYAKRVFCAGNTGWSIFCLLIFTGYILDMGMGGGVFCRFLELVGIGALYDGEAIMLPAFIFLPISFLLSLLSIILLRDGFPWYGKLSALLTAPVAFVISFVLYGSLSGRNPYPCAPEREHYQIMVEIACIAVFAVIAALQIAAMIRYFKRKDASK